MSENMSLLAATLRNVVVERFQANDMSSAALYAWTALRFDKGDATADLINSFCAQLVDRIDRARADRAFDVASQIECLRTIFEPEALPRDRTVARELALARRKDAERAMLSDQLQSAAGFCLAALALDPGDQTAIRLLRESASGLSARFRSVSRESPTLEGTLAASVAAVLGFEDLRHELAALLYDLGDFRMTAALCRQIEAEEGAAFVKRIEAKRLELLSQRRSQQMDQAAAEIQTDADIRAWLLDLGPASSLEEDALRSRINYFVNQGCDRQVLEDLRALRRFDPEDSMIARAFCTLLRCALHEDVVASLDIVVRDLNDDIEQLLSWYNQFWFIGATAHALRVAERLSKHVPEYVVIGALHEMATDLDAQPAHVFGRSRQGLNLIYANLACWGESYIDNLERFAIASLLAPGNIPALSARADVVVELFTYPRDVERLLKSKPLLRLAEHCEIRVHCFPDLVVTHNKSFGYALYGYASHATALRAERDGADVMFLVADGVYAEGSYRTVSEKLTKRPKAIFADGLNVYSGPMLVNLRRFDQGDALIIPAPDLIEAALSCLSGRSLNSIYHPDDRRTCQIPTRVIFPTDKGLRTHAFLMNPVYVSHAALAPFIMKNFGTPDSLICEHLLNRLDESEVEVLSGEDYCFIEVNEGDGYLVPMTDIDLVGAVRNYFVGYALGRNRLRLFERPIHFPTRSPPNLPLVSDEEARAKLRAVREMFATDPRMVDLAEEQERVRATYYSR